MKIAAFDIGGTALKMGVVAASGELLEKGKQPISDSDGDQILAAMESWIAAHPECTGIAISAPGYVNPHTGYIEMGGAIRKFDNFAINAWLEERTGLPVAIENDANCVLLAERWQGKARDMANCLVMTIGTGIGGAIFFGLEDAKGRVKNYPLGTGYLIGGEPVEIIAPAPAKAPKRTISRSGSIAVKNAPARVARASRIWVEGLHDAELVEKVWGHDLRVEGIVVEPLHGVDDLAGAVREFAPGPGRRLGILVDHLIEGTKEQRIVAEALAVPGAAGHVKIVGHPFIDIWQAVKPSVLGLKAWPQVPRGEDFKKGTLRRLGQPHETQADVAQAWKHILSRVDSYADLDPTLLGPVESLIDFLTEPGA